MENNNPINPLPPIPPGQLTSPTPKKIHSKIIAVIVLVIIAGVASYIALTRQSSVQPIVVNDKTEQPLATSIPQQATTIVASTQTIYTYDFISPNPNSYDGQITRTDSKTGNKIILVASIKNAFPELKSQANVTLSKLSFPANADKLFFEEILSDTDSGPIALVSYDLKQQKFTKLQVSQYWQFDYTPQVSSDGQRLLAAYDTAKDGGLRKLYSLNLETDTASLLVTLSQNETLDSCDGDCMGISTDFSWIDSNTAQYAVYHFTKQAGDANGGLSHPLIEKRKVISNNYQPSSITETKIDTSNWKIYNNTKLDFQMKYPVGWTYKQATDNATGLASVQFYPPGTAPDLTTGYAGDIILDTLNNPKKLDLKTFYQSQDMNVFAESTTQTPLTINGYEAERFIGVYGEIPSNQISVNLGQVVVELIDVAQQHANDGITDAMANSIK